VGKEDGRPLSLHFVVDPDASMIGKWHEINSLSKNSSRSRSEPGLHPVAGELGSRKDRIGAIEHGLAMLRAKGAEVDQEKRAYSGLGGQLSNWRDEAVTRLSDECRVIIQSRAFRRQHADPQDVVCIAGTRLAIRACDMTSALFDSAPREDKGLSRRGRA
jgi:hypothetical protein